VFFSYEGGDKGLLNASKRKSLQESFVF